MKATYNEGISMRTAQWIGGLLIVAGALVLAGYGLFFYFDEFFRSPDVPLAIKASVPAIIVGMLVLLVVVALQRIQSRKRETFREEEY